MKISYWLTGYDMLPFVEKKKGTDKMQYKRNKKTTHVRVTAETKAKIDALCQVLRWDQQTVIEEAVNRIEGKVKIKFEDDPKQKADECPGHQRLPPFGTARTGGVSRFSARKVETL